MAADERAQEDAEDVPMPNPRPEPKRPARIAPLFAPKAERLREHRRRSAWQVYLIRHGNVATESYTAGPDAVLSALGRQQAAALRRQLATLTSSRSSADESRPGRVLAVTSPLRRAIDTALLALSALPSARADLRVLVDLREVRTVPGDAGSPGSALAQHYSTEHPALAAQLAALDDGPWWHSTSAREPLSVARRRAAAVRKQLEAMAEDYRCVIVFGHATLFQLLGRFQTRMANCEVRRLRL